ncbi:Helicase, C-terminal domain and Helicase-associated domain and DNA/RNA helicase, DEAD/DEAH box type, N-terminal domain and Domain of unknown function DUF1605 domain and Helicase, superfamily 1/2, ATP-binding domain and P-loop containing nucleoside triphosphate hydrolase domain-containing protein [Strongyloides ratti]|uniref:Helicase ATP-binding domain-containing protein n=1 Tax=Strongyloides ratti TaxID=34506 RepID=A0A090KXE1_STRRB|nr:Helicase, C-terminal domain and Helicase-associated domain and DNA/RNA helicase, DEAD/DEAH box type, N-terminal domain and Domain of unknown function DUF1605 domain and Helicase, superfamily 1/2, ATP-binding domain and P-loop containing nucleoside triphosphate hydrolase domain-containing protein [Strongyloides ratti]CEF62165.2 Helicase, C-terminal domain and Helicase-associated domain and DNA/RNA helicase, DEAD/DEAH box type, N-terminal domain and Domain of unknown function DUF1605 domain and H
MGKLIIFGEIVTIENAKTLLNQILLEEGIQQAIYTYKDVIRKKKKKICSTLKVTLLSNGKKYLSKHTSISKESGSIACAYKILQQIANDDKYIDYIKENTSETKNEKNMIKERMIKVPDDFELYEDIKAFYNFINVTVPDLEDNCKKPITINFPSTLNFNNNIENICTDNNNNNIISNVWFPPISKYNCWLNCPLTQKHKWWNKEIEEISQILFNIETKKKENIKMKQIRQKLPVYIKRTTIIEASECCQVLLIKSSTGSGKSTQIPQIFLEHYISTYRGGEFNCIITQPRRLSAISLAKRVAEERGETLGKSVGYCVRFDKVDPQPFGSILFGTIGSILRKFSSGFRGISHIIVDEVHERSLETDFLLIIIKKIIQKYKKLRIILMSATIDTEQFEKFFDGIKIIEIPVNLYEVKELYLDEFIQYYKYIPPYVDISNVFYKNSNIWNSNNSFHDNTVSPVAKYIANKIEMSEEFPYDIIVMMIKESVKTILETDDYGSILVFVPGWNEIIKCIDILKNSKESNMYWCLPLHSNLTTNEQNLVFQTPPDGQIKVIISTNIAEKWTSKNSMEQRKGRAGRIRPGYCYRLLTKKFWNSLQQQNDPEIKTRSLQSTILNIKAFGLGNSKEFLSSGIEKIDDANIIESENYLKQLSALDKNSCLTYIGKVMQRLPFEPDTAKCIIMATLFNVIDSISIISAIRGSYNSLYTNSCKPKMVSNFILKFCGNFMSDHLLASMIFKKVINSKDEADNNINIYEYIKLTTINNIEKVRSQLSSILEQYFIEYSFTDYRTMKNEISCPSIHVIMSILVSTLYPNIAYQNEKYTFESMDKCKLRNDKFSILSLNINNFNKISPFILYSQKIINKSSTMKECSSISPLHILLFGSSKVTYNGGRNIMLDDYYLFDINPKFAHMVLYLKIIINDLLNSYCVKKKLNEKEKAVKNFVRNLIERITTMAYNTNDRYFEKVILKNPTKVNFKKIGGATNWC